MLSAIGLALDLIGAVVLVVGLFGHARALYPGWSVRSPDDVAHDHAAGLVGGSFLVTGFVLQSLTYFDVRYDCSAGRTLATALMVLVGGMVVAWIAYGTLYVVFERLEVRRIATQHGDSYPKRRFKRGIRFWLGTD